MNDSMIEESATRLFAQNVDRRLIEAAEAGSFAQALWTQVEEHGFAHALVSEAAGGIGLSWEAAFPILSALGHYAVPLPLAETMVASCLLAMADVPVPTGPITLVEHLSANAGSARIHGQAPGVPWARHCASALASLQDGRLTLLNLSDRQTVRITHGQDLAGMPSDGVRFDACVAHSVFANPLPGLSDPLRVLAAAARSAMISGTLEWVLAQTVQYANDRVQFGRPIGRYQAIQQQLALMAGDVVASRVAAQVAARDMPHAAGADATTAWFSAAVAKVRAGEAATRATGIAHQVHGALGFTQEHMLHFATRRLWAWRESYGSDAWWAQRLGQAAIGAGGDTFWSGITRKSFVGQAQDSGAS